MSRIATLIGMRSAARRHELLRGHLEAAVAVDRPHHLLGAADLGADRRRHREAHGAEPARHDERVGIVELPALAGPHLVLTDARRDDRVVGRVVAQHVDAELRLERAVLELLVDQRVLLLPRVWICAIHSSSTGQSLRAFSARTAFTISSMTRPAIADDRHVGTADLAELGRVDVDVDDLRAWCERTDLAGDAVVEARAERDEQIGLLHRGDRGVVAVHARHAEAQLVVVGERAACHQRRHHREAGELGELTQRLRGARALRMPPPT